MDLILGNFNHLIASLAISSIFYVIGDSVLYIYHKTLMERKYYHFMDVLFITGIIDSILYFLTFIFILIVQNIRGTYGLIFKFYEYYENYGAWQMISIFLTGFIPRGMILFMLELKILDILGPNFVYMSYQIGKMPSTIISIEGNEKWAVLVLSIIEIFIFMFYLEILEYNFCSLNKNTKKGIEERGIRYSISESDINDEDCEVDIKGYNVTEIIKTEDKIEDLIEMNKIFEEEESKD